MSKATDAVESRTRGVGMLHVQKSVTVMRFMGEELGSGVTNLKVGDRVGLSSLMDLVCRSKRQRPTPLTKSRPVAARHVYCTHIALQSCATSHIKEYMTWPK